MLDLIRDNSGFFIFTFLLVLPSIYALSALAVEELYEKWTIGGVLAALLFSCFPVLNLIMIAAMSQSDSGFRKWKVIFNRTMYCHSCGIYSYYGHTLVHEKMDGEKELCPYCNSEKVEESDIDKGIMGEKFTIWSSIKLALFIIKVENSIKKQGQKDFLVEQMEKYIKIEKQKLNYMTRK